MDIRPALRRTSIRRRSITHGWKAAPPQPARQPVATRRRPAFLGAFASVSTVHDPLMTRPIASALTALLVFALVASTAVAPVAADHGEDADTAFSTDETNWFDMAKGAVSGIKDRVSYTVSNLFNDTERVDQSRDDAIQTFNEHNTTFVDYLNARGIHDGEVVKVTFVQGGERSTAFIVADYNTTSEEYESAEAVRSTDRSVDHKVRLEGMAADNADEELERFHDEFAEPDTDITTKYASEMASKYARLIDEPFTQ